MDTPTRPGWYPDADGQERWFDGTNWTSTVRTPEPDATAPAFTEGWGTPPVHEPPTSPEPLSYDAPTGYGAPPSPYGAPYAPYGAQAGEVSLDKPLPGADMGQAVKRFFSRWNQVAGRSSRAEFWWAYLALFLANIVVNLIPFVGAFASLMLALVTFVPLLTLTIRRYHDTNRSGWWLLLPSAAQVLTLSGIVAIFAAILMEWDTSGEYDSVRTSGSEALWGLGFAGIILGFILGIWSLVQLAGASRPEGARFDQRQ